MTPSEKIKRSKSPMPSHAKKKKTVKAVKAWAPDSIVELMPLWFTGNRTGLSLVLRGKLPQWINSSSRPRLRVRVTLPHPRKRSRK